MLKNPRYAQTKGLDLMSKLQDKLTMSGQSSSANDAPTKVVFYNS
jgi:hypothetical protein